MDFSDIPITREKPEGKLAEPLTFDDIPVSPPPTGLERYAPETLTTDEESELAAKVGREHPYVSNLAGAILGLGKGVLPHSLGEYAERVFPPYGAYKTGQRLASGDISEIPIAGRIPELIDLQRNPPPAGDIRRWDVGLRTLGDVSLLLGGGARPRPSSLRPPPVPEWAARGPQLAIPPESPFAGTSEQLAQAVQRAGRTRMDEALAEQAGRQAQPPLLREQFEQPPQQLEGAAPPYDPMAAARWHQQVQAEMQPLIAQEYLLKKMGQPVPKPLADSIKAGNEKLKQGYQPPPESRFVIPAQPEGAPNAQQVISPARAYGNVQQPQRPRPSQAPGNQMPAPVGGAGVPARGQGAQVPAGNVVSQSTPPAGQPAAPGPGIANVYLEEQVAAGQLPAEAVAHGTGTTAKRAAREARAELKRDPNAALQAARRVSAGKMLPGDPARIHAWNDMLAENAAQAQMNALANRLDKRLASVAEAAEKAHVDFLQNVVPKAKVQAQEAMVGFQGAEPLDHATYNGMRQEILNFNGGKPLERSQMRELYKRDAKGRQLKKKERDGLDRMQREIDRTSPRTKTPSREEMHSEMNKFVEELTPCT